ncbi:hypothetical protein EV356DRAFT_496935 [Viridothelium virens]|uniref:Uncharacterized protein n=1 Tax=Viridothelium virens TaxID=1048519 RepID=A0A6A6GTL3_VIRVR|nr:hypothetical protein EV356DRAFT_496935 [Viridothelium virens]
MALQGRQIYAHGWLTGLSSSSAYISSSNTTFTASLSSDLFEGTCIVSPGISSETLAVQQAIGFYRLSASTVTPFTSASILPDRSILWNGSFVVLDSTGSLETSPASTLAPLTNSRTLFFSSNVE